ncbi:M3 family metallopeptidase [Sporosarcina sp. GW1-11]|uniref:M3 family metallopeptidase n=1 Tax=Sporosarcina sp. GW1-11 TaxID=2899126 RepID=UPI00294C8883|nr:M3 family metallopeptidase [Sporosarcina sp. GW1-11]MDV6378094.1 M3 family metallopeptidase [Sporosarcina sp. GW1-11]
MYSELSRETGRFFEYMKRKNLLDLVAKPDKEAGGYCTFIDNYDSPFIFSNFNGTSSDMDVLTHEAGHAFQVYSSRSIGIPEYICVN